MDWKPNAHMAPGLGIEPGPIGESAGEEPLHYLLPLPLTTVTVRLPTRCLVDRSLHRPHGCRYLIMCVSDVVTVQ